MEQLIFVYNADSGLANSLLDYGKKYIYPDNYDCKLCMVSYGAFGMKNEWRYFVSGLPLSVRFMHRDELQKEFPRVKVSLPALIHQSQDSYTVLLDSHDFQRITSLDDLKKAVKTKTAELS